MDDEGNEESMEEGTTTRSIFVYESDDSVSDKEVNIDTSLKAEFFELLQDKRETLDSLEDYTKVGKLFKQFNAPLSSSAPIDRLFSVAGDGLTAIRNRLEDAKFDNLIY